jgi:hypothetical protein
MSNHPRPTLQIRLTLPAAKLARIERATRGDTLSRNDAIRRVIDAGLELVERRSQPHEAA